MFLDAAMLLVGRLAVGARRWFGHGGVAESLRGGLVDGGAVDSQLWKLWGHCAHSSHLEVNPYGSGHSRVCEFEVGQQERVLVGSRL
jgi:hypothetical protein